MSPWEFACKWYRTEDIHRAINARNAPKIPADVKSREFAEFLTEIYRLAMTKGIQIGREWDLK